MPESPDDGVRWLAGVLAEMLRVGLSGIARRYPEMRGKIICPACGYRQDAPGAPSPAEGRGKPARVGKGGDRRTIDTPIIS